MTSRYCSTGVRTAISRVTSTMLLYRNSKRFFPLQSCRAVMKIISTAMRIMAQVGISNSWFHNPAKGR